MPQDFWDRERELAAIRGRAGRSGLGFVTGRRRIGKTALLAKACGTLGGLYHQAVEGTPQQQLLHFAEEVSGRLPVFREVVPRGWDECLALLSRERLPRLLVFDEFPYWAQGAPALLSLFQKWVDHALPRHKCLVLLSGSSQAMLFSEFLSHGSPLYGRASLHLHLQPLDFGWFCRAQGCDPREPASFERFSLVGGVPYYWNLMPEGSLLEQADGLYFQPASPLSEEPTHLLRDEHVTGAVPKALLDLAGRGVAKPSELAARLGVPQGNISRPLALLLELGLLRRELPFGESLRTTKKVLYSLEDPALAFYYGTCLPHRGRWPVLSATEREGLVRRHASRRWEDHCRRSFPGSGRYWEGDVEIDLVAPLGGRRHLVAECKWSHLDPRKESALLSGLKEKFARTALARTLGPVDYRVLSKADLGRL